MRPGSNDGNGSSTCQPPTIPCKREKWAVAFWQSSRASSTASVRALGTPSDPWYMWPCSGCACFWQCRNKRPNIPETANDQHLGSTLRAYFPSSQTAETDLTRGLLTQPPIPDGRKCFDGRRRQTPWWLDNRGCSDSRAPTAPYSTYEEKCPQ
jgi:hypothetical protein